MRLTLVQDQIMGGYSVLHIADAITGRLSGFFVDAIDRDVCALPAVDKALRCPYVQRFHGAYWGWYLRRNAEFVFDPDEYYIPAGAVVRMLECRYKSDPGFPRNTTQAPKIGQPLRLPEGYMLRARVTHDPSPVVAVKGEAILDRYNQVAWVKNPVPTRFIGSANTGEDALVSVERIDWLDQQPEHRLFRVPPL